MSLVNRAAAMPEVKTVRSEYFLFGDKVRLDISELSLSSYPFQTTLTATAKHQWDYKLVQFIAAAIRLYGWQGDLRMDPRHGKMVLDYQGFPGDPGRTPDLHGVLNVILELKEPDNGP